MTQFYKLTLEAAIAHYQQGDLTAKGLIHIYLLIKCKPGWKIKLEHKKVCKELGIQKTAFYNAISRLKAEGSIAWESPEGILVSISESFRKCGNYSVNAERQSANAESNSVNAEQQSANAENKSSKSAPVKAYSVPPDSYQIFIRSLSNSTREKFFNFVKKKIEDFPKPINDVEAWLAGFNQAGQERFRVYYGMFQKEIGEAFAPSQDWANHPKYQEWLEALKRYPKGFPYMKEWTGSLEEKKAFADWAFGNNLVWESKT